MMKLFAIAFSALLLLSNAHDTPSLRGLGRGGGRGGGGGGGDGKGGSGGQGEGHGEGGGGGKGGKGRGKGKGKGKGKHELFSIMKGNCYWGANESQPLLDRLEEECAANDPCGEVFPGQLDVCTNPIWETMDDEGVMIEGCPDEGLTDELKEDLKIKLQAKKEKWMNMTADDRTKYKEQKEAMNEANAVTVRLCGCCKGTASIASLVEGKEGAVAKTLGFRRPRDDSDSSGDGFGGHGFGGHGHHGKPGSWSSHGSSVDLESMLEEKCPSFLQEDGCANAEAAAGGKINCGWFDSVNLKRGRRPKSKLYCGCGCRDLDGDVDPVDPVDPLDPDDFGGD